MILCCHYTIVYSFFFFQIAKLLMSYVPLIRNIIIYLICTVVESLATENFRRRKLRRCGPAIMSLVLNNINMPITSNFKLFIFISHT